MVKTKPHPVKRNPAHGKWSEEETNWSQKDTDLIKPILKERTVPYTQLDIIELKLDTILRWVESQG